MKVKCERCDGTGIVENYICEKCFGDKKIPWLDNLIQKEQTENQLLTFQLVRKIYEFINNGGERRTNIELIDRNNRKKFKGYFKKLLEDLKKEYQFYRYIIMHDSGKNPDDYFEYFYLYLQLRKDSKWTLQISPLYITWVKLKERSLEKII